MAVTAADVVVHYVYGFLVLTGVWITFSLVYRLFSYPKVVNYVDKHVVIVGGSEGICKQLAQDFLKKKSKVTIMARTLSKLEAAASAIVKEAGVDKSKCNVVQIDVTENDTIPVAFQEAEKSFGPIDVIVIGTGKAYPDYLLDQDIEIFERTVDLNYLGLVRCVKAVVPLMLDDLKNKKKGKARSKTTKQICIIGSACSYFGFLGYGSYAPTKFAAKGFADTLRNELIGTGIKICFASPPDTDTPGFEEENKTKPKENVEMVPPEVYSAKSVSNYIIGGMQRNEYTLLSPDVGQNLLIASMSGITARNRWAPLFIGLSPLIHVFLLFYKWNCDRVGTKYGKRLLLDEAAPAQKSSSEKKVN